MTFSFPLTLEHNPDTLIKVGFVLTKTHDAITLTLPEGWKMVDDNDFVDQMGVKRGFFDFEDGGYVHLFPRFRIEIMDDIDDILDKDHCLGPITMGVFDETKGDAPIHVVTYSDWFVANLEARKWLLEYISEQGLSYHDDEMDKMIQMAREALFLYKIFHSDSLFDPSLFWQK